ncbi:MAG: Gfo/Idh/MocA family oxidoreductase [Siculibacillus sp.]|nr:Gfo/Idh/MocA family oxidoreductase [Siculibacillus sp.]
MTGGRGENEKARLLVVGHGLIGRAHAERIRAHPQTELAGIVDPSPAVEAEAAGLAVPLFADLAEAVDALAPDGVVLATPNRLHEAGALTALGRGVPVLIEKPIADDFEAAKRIVAEQHRTGVAALVGHHRRHGTAVRRAIEAVRGGAIGEVVTVSGLTLFLKPADYFDTEWRRLPGAGPILVNLIHDIDLVRAIAGEIVEVQALVSNRRRGFAVEDTAGILARFENGAIGTFVVSDTAVSPWSWETTSGEAPVYPRNDEHCLHIAGTRGALSLPDLTLWRHPEPTGWYRPLERTSLAGPRVDPLVEQISNFVAVIRGEAAPRVDAAEGARTLAVVEAIRRAATTGETVRVPAI